MDEADSRREVNSTSSRLENAARLLTASIDAFGIDAILDATADGGLELRLMDGRRVVVAPEVSNEAVSGWRVTLPGEATSGDRTTSGTRMPPSNNVPLA